MISQKKLAIAMSVALGGSIAAVAHADSAFFPQVVYSPSVTTIISVVNESPWVYTSAGLPDQTQKGGYLHYRLFYKDLLAAEPNHETCDEVNTFLPTSKFDIQTFDIGAVTSAPGDLGVMFNDPSVNNDWEAVGRSFALGTTTGLAAFRGYLVVDNSDFIPFPPLFESVSGEAVMVEFISGSAWGYTALDREGNDPSFLEDGSWEGIPGGEFDYGFNGEMSGTASPVQVAMMPWAEVSTSFLVTPLYAKDQGEAKEDGGFDYDSVSGSIVPPGVNDYEATIALGAGPGFNYVLYDRDEVIVSGSAPKKVVCVGRVNAPSLLTAGAQNLMPDGGWGNLFNYTTLEQSTSNNPNDNVSRRIDSAAVVIKHEAGDSINGFATGRWNNAIILPDQRDSFPYWDAPLPRAEVNGE